MGKPARPQAPSFTPRAKLSGGARVMLILRWSTGGGALVLPSLARTSLSLEVLELAFVVAWLGRRVRKGDTEVEGVLKR